MRQSDFILPATLLTASLIALAIALVALGAPPAAAAPANMLFVVNQTDDPSPAVCNILHCSLRGAIIAANANPGLDTIRLQHGTTYHVNTNVSGSNDNATTGDLNITESIIFDFADMNCTSNCIATIQGALGGNDRVFSIQNGAVVQMTWLAIQGGDTRPGSNVTGNRNGGGVYVDATSAVTLTNSTVSNNYAYSGGGIYNLGRLAILSSTISLNVADVSQGGGIYSNQGGGVVQPGPLTIDHSTIISNAAQTDGGGLMALRSATLSNTIVQNNHAMTGWGAGLYLESDPAVLTNVQVISNTAHANASRGGGIFDWNAPLTLTGSTVGWNQADHGGGILTNSGANVQMTNGAVINNVARAGDGGGILAVDWALATFTLNNMTISGNRATGSGGGIDVGQAVLDHVTLSGNTADSDHNGAGSGGGIHMHSSSPLTLTNSTLTGNSASAGGGIATSNGALVMTWTSVTGNTATTGDGGGLFSGGSNTIGNSTISGNKATLGNGGGMRVSGSTAVSGSVITSNDALASASMGGGIFNQNGLLSLANTTVSSNTGAYGGGVAVYAAGLVPVEASAIINNTATVDGGGIEDIAFFSTSVFTLTNTTVSGNQAKNSGGGMNVGLAGLYNVTLTNNQADSDRNGSGNGGGIFLNSASGHVTLANSILAGNIDPGGQPPDCAVGSILSLGYNLIESAGGCTITGDTTGNLIGTNPLLAPLGNNGGPTLTHALLTGSSAINGGNPGGCLRGTVALTTDQRGYVRPSGPRCDIGAFELSPSKLFLPLLVK